jgi:hypothetical protein
MEGKSLHYQGGLLKSHTSIDSWMIIESVFSLRLKAALLITFISFPSCILLSIIVKNIIGKRIFR